MTRSRTIALSGVGMLALAAPLLAPLVTSAATDAPPTAPTFQRADVDTAVTGAAFTALGEVFPGEKNIITSGYGALTNGVPAGGGTLQVYRPGKDLGDWDKVEVFGASEEIIFPNRPTVTDMDGDGLNDIVLPSGYFFDTNPAKQGGSQSRSAITWWKNLGVDAKGVARGFTRHDIVTGVGPSYHGVDLVDLDGDGVRDILTTAEAGNVADNQDDDVVRLEYLRGLGGNAFAAPVTLAEGLGGSHPVAHDVDGDGRLDVVSSQYFNLSYTDGSDASFLWFRQHGEVGESGLSAAHFEAHTIATAGTAGFGFQIQPVVGFREPGKVSWIGTNHQGRCFVQRVLKWVIDDIQVDVPEMVMEFVPGDDLTQPWEMRELSVPENRAADPITCADDFQYNPSTLIHPTDHITARSSGGQAGPGVFGHGDLDGDGDVDLAVSGDGDRRLFWIEQTGAATSGPDSTPGTTLHTLTSPGEVFGQSGGAVVDDLNDDGVPDMVFSSFDTSTVAIWTSGRVGPKPTPTPTPTTTPRPTVAPTPAPVKVTTYRTSLRVKARSKRPVAGKNSAWRVTLTGAPKGKARTVTVTFTPKGSKKAKVVKRLRVSSGKGRNHTVRMTWKPRRDGTLKFRYAGGTVSSTAKEKASSRSVKVRVRR